VALGIDTLEHDLRLWRTMGVPNARAWGMGWGSARRHGDHPVHLFLQVGGFDLDPVCTRSHTAWRASLCPAEQGLVFDIRWKGRLDVRVRAPRGGVVVQINFELAE
jgi:glycyl-tRNA synthetase alpha subunit